MFDRSISTIPSQCGILSPCVALFRLSKCSIFNVYRMIAVSYLYAYVQLKLEENPSVCKSNAPLMQFLVGE